MLGVDMEVTRVENLFCFVVVNARVGLYLSGDSSRNDGKYSHCERCEMKRAQGIRVDGTTHFAIPKYFSPQDRLTTMQTQTGP